MEGCWGRFRLWAAGPMNKRKRKNSPVKELNWKKNAEVFEEFGILDFILVLKIR